MQDWPFLKSSAHHQLSPLLSILVIMYPIILSFTFNLQDNRFLQATVYFVLPFVIFVFNFRVKIKIDRVFSEDCSEVLTRTSPFAIFFYWRIIPSFFCISRAASPLTKTPEWICRETKLKTSLLVKQAILSCRRLGDKVKIKFLLRNKRN